VLVYWHVNYVCLYCIGHCDISTSYNLYGSMEINVNEMNEMRCRNSVFPCYMHIFVLRYYFIDLNAYHDNTDIYLWFIQKKCFNNVNICTSHMITLIKTCNATCNKNKYYHINISSIYSYIVVLVAMLVPLPLSGFCCGYEMQNLRSK
jgi:magnesium-transporting ATPase (P-type)